MSFGSISGGGGGGGGLSQEAADLLYAPIEVSTTVTDLVVDVAALEGNQRWVKLYDATIDTASNTHTATFTTTADLLNTVVSGRTGRAAATGSVYARFNGSSTLGHYLDATGTSGTLLTLGTIPGALTNTNRRGHVESWINNTLNAVKSVGSRRLLTEASTSTTTHSVAAVGQYTQDPQLTQIEFLTDGGESFIIGTRFQVFARAA